MQLPENFTIAWWSGGITSAVACRLALEKYPNVVLLYIETGSHHPDTQRFKTDCERWYGAEIHTLQSAKYSDVLDVILSTKYVNGVGGARCTTELKKAVRLKFEREHEGRIAHQVWGFEHTAHEINRAVRVQEQYPHTNPLFPLIENKLSKNECAGIIAGAGIEIPAMYKLGYNNNNCIGCVKGGAGYWNKIREDFPEVFAQMAAVEREVGASCMKVFLDELPADSGRHTDLVLPECGIFCQVDFAEIMHPKTKDVIDGKASIYD